MDVSGILAMVKGLFDKLEKENVIKLPDNFDNLWDEIETTKPDTDTVTLTGGKDKDVTGSSDIEEITDILEQVEELADEKTEEKTPVKETKPMPDPITGKKPEEEDTSKMSNYELSKKYTSVDPASGENFTAFNFAYYNSGGTLPTQKRNLLVACKEWPEIYQPFVEAGLVRINEYGDYEIADQDAVDRLYGDDNCLSMGEMKGLLKDKWDFFDVTKIKEYIASQPPISTDASFVANFPEEGMTVEEFVQSYRDYPEILDVFEKTNMINVGRWNELSEGSGFASLTKNSDGKITKEVLEGLLTDGKFDPEKIVQKSGRSKWACYTKLQETKDQLTQAHKENLEAAQKYMEYYNSLSYEEKKSIAQDPASVYRTVTAFLDMYNSAMSDLFGADIHRDITNLTYYLRNNRSLVMEAVKSKMPGIL